MNEPTTCVGNLTTHNRCLSSVYVGRDSFIEPTLSTGNSRWYKKRTSVGRQLPTDYDIKFYGWENWVPNYTTNNNPRFYNVEGLEVSFDIGNYDFNRNRKNKENDKKDVDKRKRKY